MRFASTRLITEDLDRLVAFYETVTGLSFEHPNPAFAELPTPHGATLSIGDTSTLSNFVGTGLVAAANTSTILEFQVDDVDAVRERLTDDMRIVQPPTTMPWGNRAMMLLDPDGNRVSFYAPITDAAKERFAGR